MAEDFAIRWKDSELRKKETQSSAVSATTTPFKGSGGDSGDGGDSDFGGSAWWGILVNMVMLQNW